MAKYLFTALLIGTAATAWAQAPPNDNDKSRTLSGCVINGSSPHEAVTFSDGDTGNKYRLTGKNVKKYAGQRVEIVGGAPNSKLAIRGGLYPSPNVAAQAGHLDPAKAAIAAQPGGTESGTGSVDVLPEFRVTRVRALAGACQ